MVKRRLPAPSSDLVHDEDEQGQQQQPSQNRQGHHPPWNGSGGLGHPDYRQDDGGAVGRQLRGEVLVRHLDDAEGGRRSDRIGPVLVFCLQPTDGPVLHDG